MVLPLPNQRIDAVRDSMKDRDLDALLVYSQRRGQITYLSGYRPNYHTNSAFLCLPREGDPVLLIKFGFDMPRARAMSWVEDIRAGHSEDVWCLFSEFAGILAERGLDRARLGWVASDETIDEMSSTLYGAMHEGLPDAHLERASDLVNSCGLERARRRFSRCAGVRRFRSWRRRPGEVRSPRVSKTLPRRRRPSPPHWPPVPTMRRHPFGRRPPVSPCRPATSASSREAG